MATKKKYLKLIRKATDEMPVLMRPSHEYQLRPGSALIKDNRDEVEGKPIDPLKNYKDVMPVQIAVNHTRKLKKLVKQYGTKVIPVYAEAMEESKPKI